MQQQLKYKLPDSKLDLLHLKHQVKDVGDVEELQQADVVTADLVVQL